MKGFLGGLAIGLAAGAASALFVGDDSTEPRAQREQNDAPERALGEPAVPADGGPSGQGADDDLRGFSPGTAILRIGDGYVFSEVRARPGASARNVGVVCLDLGKDVVLRGGHGIGPALLPVVFPGDPPATGQSFALVYDAPPDLAPGELRFSMRPVGQESGVALVRAGDGELFKVVIEELHTDPHALRRFVRLRYAPVEARDGGGVVRVKGALASTSVSVKEAAGIRELFHPPAGFRARLAHKVENVPFIGIKRLPLDFVLTRRGAFVVGEPFRGSLDIRRRAAILLRGVLHDGKVKGSHSLHLVVDGGL